jgi:hypothetical protein
MGELSLVMLAGAAIAVLFHRLCLKSGPLHPERDGAGE